MQTAQKIIEAIKARYHLIRRWTGRPGYTGFGVLGLGIFISGVRHDGGMALLLVTVVIAFIGEYMRLVGQKGSGL